MNKNKYQEALNKIGEEISSLEVIKELVDKETEQLVDTVEIPEREMAIPCCKNCNHLPLMYHFRYCSNCGQKLKW